MLQQYKGEESGVQVGGKITLHTHYVRSATDREKLRIRFRNGLAYDSAGNLISDPMGMDFVMDSAGNLYSGKYRVAGRDWRHSSYMAGEPVTFAGSMRVINGRVTFINNNSGHYALELERVKYVLQILKENGANLSQIHVENFPNFSRKPAMSGAEFLKRAGTGH